jgi:hypothetical protein
VSRVVLGLAVLPMLVVSFVFVASIGMECSPGHASTAEMEVGGAAFAWGAFLAVAVPSYLLGRGQPPVWRVALAVALALGAGAMAISMVGLVVLAPTC